MEKTEITITRGLANLKLSEKRIKKATENAVFCTYKTGDKINDDADTKANLQSINDLITQRQAIKSAISESNAKTEVTIGSVQMTVATAIEMKNSIEFRKNLLSKLKNERYRVTRNIENINEDAQRRLDDLIEVSVGNDKKSTTVTTEIEAISKTFMNRNSAVAVDELDITKVIEDLENEIDDFENNVDIALSESNGRTTIQI